MDSDKKLEVRIVSPEGVLWTGESSFSVLPALDGEVGIYPGHAPLVALLGTGEARIHTRFGISYFALFGGFLEVSEDRVSVIVDRAETPDSIDPEAAARDLEALAAPGVRDYSKHDQDLERRLRALTRIRVSRRKAAR